LSLNKNASLNMDTEQKILFIPLFSVARRAYKIKKGGRQVDKSEQDRLFKT
jgi:hypothetical protein